MYIEGLRCAAVRSDLALLLITGATNKQMFYFSRCKVPDDCHSKTCWNRNKENCLTSHGI